MDERNKRRLGTNRLPGSTGRLGGPNNGPPQEKPFLVRLDPQAKPGEFNFVIDGPDELTKKVPAGGLVAETDANIPPQLYRAVDEVLGFIYQLDQQFENKKPRKR